MPKKHFLLRPEAIFCDVDDTLIADKSLVSFASYCPWAQDSVRELKRLLDEGASREMLNLSYYKKVLGGRRKDEIKELCARWQVEVAQRKDFFVPEVADLLAEARQQKVPVILATGSFEPLITPIAEAVGAVSVISASLLCEDSVYTGTLRYPPTIGTGKAEAIARYASENDIELSRCLGLGDDESDLAFLDSMGEVRLPPRATRGLFQALVQRGRGSSLFLASPQL